jgi:osmoprotectant transport system ATP-binding protein
MFRVREVSCRFGPVVALHPTTWEFETGRTTVLVGPSGSGKSTLLRLLVGLARPATGTVAFDGTPLAPANLPEIRRRIGYVIQEGGLFPHLTAAANVALVAEYLGWPAERIRNRLVELAGLVRLSPELLSRYPRQLSGGQRQRVSLMRALMLDPAALLLDEPLGALDPITRHDLQEDLKALLGRLGKTVVLVTHDLPEAAWFGGAIVLMNEGRIVQAGSLGDLRARPADPFVTRFLEAGRTLPA